MSKRLNALGAATLLTLTLSSAPAHAEDGVWKVGIGYVVRFEKLDLSKPADRQALLGQVERTAAKACSGLRPAARRAACATDTVSAIMKSAEPGLRASLDTARFERDGVMQAAR
jgi:UrcA family protein